MIDNADAVDAVDEVAHDEETECYTHQGTKWFDCPCDKHPPKYNPVLGWFDVD